MNELSSHLGLRQARLAYGFAVHLYDLYLGAKRVCLRRLLVHRFGTFGEGSSFDPTTSTISGWEHFFIARNVFIGPHAVLSADGVRVDIGEGTVIGPNFTLMAGDHRFDTPCVRHYDSGRGRNEPVQIGRDVWIGAGVTVLKGVEIGDASVVGAGALVTRSLPPFSISMGVPARPVRERFGEEDRLRHQRFLDEH